MKDQHKKITGYRDLSQDEIDLMNEVKEHAENTKRLLNKVKHVRELEIAMKENISDDQFNESLRCLALAKTNLQQGFMWAVRAVALPDSF